MAKASNLIHLDAERRQRRGDKKLSRRELIDEVVWLLDGGTHPLLAARLLGTSWATITRYANLQGRSDEVIRQDISEWNRYAFQSGEVKRRAA